MTPPGLEWWAGPTGGSVDPRPQDGSIWTFRQRRLYRVQSGGILEDVEFPLELKGPVVEVLEARNGCPLARGAGTGASFTSGPAITGEPLLQSRASAEPAGVLYEDREGNVWRGSFGAGLARLRPRPFILHELPGAGLDRYAYSVCSDANGGVWGLLNSRTLTRVPPGVRQPELGAQLAPSSRHPGGPYVIGPIICGSAQPRVTSIAFGDGSFGTRPPRRSTRRSHQCPFRGFPVQPLGRLCPRFRCWPAPPRRSGPMAAAGRIARSRRPGHRRNGRWGDVVWHSLRGSLPLAETSAGPNSPPATACPRTMSDAFSPNRMARFG